MEDVVSSSAPPREAARRSSRKKKKRPSRSRLSFGSLHVVLLAGTLLLAFVLGGRSTAGVMPDASLQLLSVPLFCTSLYWLLTNPAAPRTSLPVLVSLAALVVPLAQLLPLPPTLWTQWASHAVVRQSFELLENPLPWWPLTLTPGATVMSGLCLVPTVAIFWGVLRLDAIQRRTLSIIVIVFGIMSAVLGIVQVSQGPLSPLRFYEDTGNEAVGFFINRNHYAAALCGSLVFTGAWLITAISRWQDQNASKRALIGSPVFMALASTMAFIVILIAAILMARSRAGVALLGVALVGLAIMSLEVARRREETRWAFRTLVPVVVFALLFSLQYTFYRISERFEADPLADARIPFARNTIEAATAMMPFGSGLGSFIPVYALYEKPRDAFERYANHAHNDYLQIWLETGVAGSVLVAILLLWIIGRGYVVWIRREGGSLLDRNLQKAALIILLLLALHSLVDYPLRTGAGAALAAMAIGLLCPPVHEHGRSERGILARLFKAFETTPPRRGRQRELEPLAPPTLAAPRPRTLWGGVDQWPETPNDATQDKSPKGGANPWDKINDRS